MSVDISISALAFSGHDFSQACKAITACGARYIEPAFIEGYGAVSEDELGQRAANTIRDQAASSGLMCRSVSAHIDTGASDALDRMKRRIDFAATVGARYLITNSGSAGTEAQFSANLGKLADFAAARDVTICIENPGDGHHLFSNARNMAEWKAKFDHPAIDLNYDFGNIFTASNEALDPALDMLAIVNTAAHFHIKDIASDATGWRMCAIGDGSVNYRAILPTLARSRPDAAFSIEMPIRLSRPGRGKPVFAPVPLAEEITLQLRRSIDFVTRHFQPDQAGSPIRI